MIKKILAFTSVIICIGVMVSGCVQNDNNNVTPVPTLTGVDPAAKTCLPTPQIPSYTPPASAFSASCEGVDADTSVVFSEDGIEVDGEGASVEENSLYITQSGDYLVTGKSSHGAIYVNTDDTSKVRIYLNGLDLTNPTGPAVYLISAPKKLVISTVKDSVSLLADGASYSEDKYGNSPDAALFAKDDIEFEGSGILYVTGNCDKGIHGKDDLTVESGDIRIKSSGDGLSGKNSVEIKGGKLTVESGGDGVVSNRDEENKDKGSVIISGGEIYIKSGGGYANAPQKNQNDGFMGGGPGGGGRPGGGRPGGWDIPGDDMTENQSEVSSKGIKATGAVVIRGGVISVDSCDDALHCDGDITVSSGSLNLASGDDGIHGEINVVLSGGNISVSKSYEGIEGRYITLSGGSVCVVASDDGVNATDGSGAAMGGGFGRPGGGFGSGQDCKLTILGGYIFINAAGDGLDSNGDIVQSGGEAIVFGPQNNGNGAIDVGDGNNSYTLTGGSVLAVGAYGMAEGVECGEGALSFSLRTGTVSGSTLVYILDSDGKCLIAFENPKSFSSIVYGSDGMKSGEYFVYSGGESSGECVNGVYTEPLPSGGSLMGSFEI